uniref:Protein kinase domain-containing protein n=1 Tax=Macrostomum lignano TaxID=282301 RepID=A0A1I8I2J6_9PLAT
MFAMKYMNKLACIEKDAVSNVLREVRIIASLDFPYLVNLWFTFQDVEDMFVVVDLLLGGDLRFHIQHGVRFSEEAVRLALAQMALALDYLRSRRILHSIAGTKPYMAPEVFLTSLRQAEGYSFPADWWSLGMTLYEMHRLKRPYDLSGDMSSADCLSSIQSAGVRYSTSTSSQLRAAVQALLEPDPNQRLSSLTQVKSHPFTRQLDWDRLLAKAAQPAFRPPRHQLNCDPTFELEEMIIESKPLHKKHKRLSKLGSSSDRS